jgi:hypothetical protein
MMAADKVRARGARTGWWPFVRHYLEMVGAMLAGMLVLGGAVRGVLALAGLAYPTRYPELLALEMAVEMSVGMAAWMRWRRHGWAATLEMVGVAMFAPLAVLFPLLWLGAIGGGAVLVLEHVAMFPLMLLVMLRRRAEYGAPPS